ncbi:uncharacterized protein LOC131241047 isoform X2 [Magnolia sinica]|uniref:uncharacterized protein LOC131241047 isoform X2 n=1 Tax=Magnolia sinica TaxID=86752 RepID=UPI00265862FD|nr:uncharacterized protein LOC131241047 isoform X2 [Magnolia sinica]
MFEMDLTSKGINWVGNIYQKFEAICQDVYQEVDGIMIQEKAKYVESQVQTSCENVRKFCAEVVQDLLLPPASSVKVPVSDLSLIYDIDVGMYKKTKEGFEECPVNEKTMLHTESEVVVFSGKDSSSVPFLAEPQEVNHRDECGALTEKSVLIPIDVITQNYPKNVECMHINASEVVADIADLSSVHPSASVVLITSHGNEVVENRPVPLGHVMSTDVIGTGKSLKTSSLVESSGKGHEKLQKTRSMVEPSGNGHDQQSEPAVLDTVLASPETGRSIDFDWEEASKTTDALEPSTESEEEFEDVKFEDDSVDAEVKDGAHSISRQNSKKGSYKKKLRDAFSSKLRFAKKRDYDRQMATWTGEFNTGIKQKGLISTSSTVIVDLDPKKSGTHDSYESEWELL